MECCMCNALFNDGVLCGTCKRYFDYGCAQITETGWRKLGADRRAAWKCGSCKTATVSTSLPESVSLESIMREIRSMKNQLTGLPNLVESFNDIKTELSHIKASCEFLGGKLEDFSIKINNFEDRLFNLEKLDGAVRALEEEISTLKTQAQDSDNRSRLNNIEIKGVPVKKDENLFSILDSISKSINCNIDRNQINYIYRIQSSQSKEKSIIVSFLNRYIKEDFVAAGRATTNLCASNIGFKDFSHRIYINDHLSSKTKLLLNSVKSLAKEKGYQYTWIKYGKIHVRKNNTSRVLIISRKSDLNKIS
ncbi:uncharacterized protein LOC123703653 [Colias croceus]|uniref:uncharacterized protein LOC123703653 n=1 Tax=Colias crocea TaxID=72248 RepID=UPI001E27A62E|nr:uncharacterized protein LOC123703653 [Colias croceus]